MSNQTPIPQATAYQAPTVALPYWRGTRILGALIAASLIPSGVIGLVTLVEFFTEPGAAILVGMASLIWWGPAWAAYQCLRFPDRPIRVLRGIWESFCVGMFLMILTVIAMTVATTWVR